LIVETSRTYKDNKGVVRHRIINVLQPQKWTEIFSKKIYDQFRMTHGYHFKNSYVYKFREQFGKIPRYKPTTHILHQKSMSTNTILAVNILFSILLQVIANVAAN